MWLHKLCMWGHLKCRCDSHSHWHCETAQSVSYATVCWIFPGGNIVQVCIHTIENTDMTSAQILQEELN